MTNAATMRSRMLGKPGVLTQIICFGAVGGLATLTHVGVAILSEAVLALSPQLANLSGYLFAVVVSYTGHALVTFKARVQSGAQFMRFILVSLLGLATSSTTVWVTMGVLSLSFHMAMLCVTVAVPMVTYLGMRFWVFDGRSEAAVAPGDVLVPVGLGLGLAAVFWDRLVNHDIAWYLFATRDWLAGASL
jgi:putative flippase GtrA